MVEKWRVSTALSAAFFIGIILLGVFYPNESSERAITNLIIMAVMFYIIAGLVYYKTTPNAKSLLLKIMGGVAILSLIGSYMDAANLWGWLGISAVQVMFLKFPIVVMGMEQNIIIVLAIARGALFFLQSGGNFDEVVGTLLNSVGGVVEQAQKVAQESSRKPQIEFEVDDPESDPQDIFRKVTSYLVQQTPDQVSADKVKRGYKIYEDADIFVQVIIKDKKLAKARYKESVAGKVSGGQPLVKAERTR
ncbi:hypothetical protein M0R01_00295 [bacterium]|nr:hypothetical protein [bacterium]